jgi:hypothetical protein
MADTSQFMAIGQMPSVDYGAIYERSKQRRELEEQRKLDYLNQFQQERGAFAPGVKAELQKVYDDTIKAELDKGDMSFEGKARLQRNYNAYKDLAANALDYTGRINDFEASIMADPKSFNDPGALIETLGVARDTQIPLSQLPQIMQDLPNPNDYRRFEVAEMAPMSVAGDILKKLKTEGGGINRFYDMAKSGQIDPASITETVTAWFDGNQISQEQENEAIAFSMRQLGALDQDLTDYSKLNQLSEEQRLKYLQQYAGYVTDAVTNLLADDITTAAEQARAEMRQFAQKENIKAAAKARYKGADGAGGDAGAQGFQVGALEYVPAYGTDERGKVTNQSRKDYKEKYGDDGIAQAQTDLFKNVSYSQPTIVSRKGDNNVYTVESLAIGPNGEKLVSLRFNQEVAGKKKSVRTIVDFEDIKNEGIKGGQKAVDRISSDLEGMSAYWTENIFPTKNQVAPVTEDQVIMPTATGIISNIDNRLNGIDGEGIPAETPVAEETVEEASLVLPEGLDLGGIMTRKDASRVAMDLAEQKYIEENYGGQKDWDRLMGSAKGRLAKPFTELILADERSGYQQERRGQEAKTKEEEEYIQNQLMLTTEDNANFEVTSMKGFDRLSEEGKANAIGKYQDELIKRLRKRFDRGVMPTGKPLANAIGDIVRNEMRPYFADAQFIDEEFFVD